LLAGQKRKWANADTECQIQQLDAQICALQQAQAAVIQQYQHKQQAAAQQPPEQAEPMDAEQQVAVWTAEAVQARAQLVATLADALREPEMRWRSRMCTMRSIRQLPPWDTAHLIGLPGVHLVSLLREWLQAALQAGYGKRKLRQQLGERLTPLLKSLHRVDIAIWPVAEVQPVHMLLQQISRSVEFPQAEAVAAELLALIDDAAGQAAAGVRAENMDGMPKPATQHHSSRYICCCFASLQFSIVLAVNLQHLCQ